VRGTAPTEFTCLYQCRGADRGKSLDFYFPSSASRLCLESQSPLQYGDRHPRDTRSYLLELGKLESPFAGKLFPIYWSLRPRSRGTRIRFATDNSCEWVLVMRRCVRATGHRREHISRMGKYVKFDGLGQWLPSFDSRINVNRVSYNEDFSPCECKLCRRALSDYH
jgi:hypothetical protein